MSVRQENLAGLSGESPD